jgi:hypothetical protein
MKNWYGTSDWQRFCDRLPTAIETDIWSKWPEAGVCVALDHQLKVIDIDTDDGDLMGAVLSVLPDSEVKKRGAKGFSAFYRGSPAIVSAPFSVNGDRIVDLLCHGRQTVLPPTLHPTTGRPYAWVSSDTLLNTDIDSLPVLPDNIAELIAEALAPYGYEPAENRALQEGDGDTLWREVNETALLNLDKWVPALRLPDTRKSGGGYRAVAEWRGVENANLSFHKDGITDWGNNETHTAINVVMQASRADLYSATKWLVEQLGFERPSDDFDVAGFVARAKAKAAPIEKPLVAPEPMDTEEPIEPVRRDPTVNAPRKAQGLDPFDYREQGGLLGELTKWILDTSRVPVPEFATIGAIGFLSAFYGRRYVTPTDLGLNTYLVGVAGPGFGKDHPRKCVEMLGHMAKLPWLIGPNEVTSDSAIEKIVRRRPSFVMPWDEIGAVFQSMNAKNGAAWSRSVRKSLLELFSRSNGLWTGKEKADEKQDSSGDPVWYPTVSLIGFSTPMDFYEGITESNLKDGFLARLTLVVANKRPPRKDGRSILKPPQALIGLINDQITAAPKMGQFNNAAIRDPKSQPEMYAAGWSSEAKAKWKGIEEWQLSFMDERPEFEGIVGRTAEQTLKYATIRAISREPTTPRIEVDDIEWAYAIVQKSIDMIDEGVREHLSGSDFEALHKVILSNIASAGDEGIARSQLMRKAGIKQAKPNEYDGAIKWLETSEQIETKLSNGTKGGRPGIRYFAREAA